MFVSSSTLKGRRGNFRDRRKDGPPSARVVAAKKRKKKGVLFRPDGDGGESPPLSPSDDDDGGDGDDDDGGNGDVSDGALPTWRSRRRGGEKERILGGPGVRGSVSRAAADDGESGSDASNRSDDERRKRRRQRRWEEDVEKEEEGDGGKEFKEKNKRRKDEKRRSKKHSRREQRRRRSDDDDDDDETRRSKEKKKKRKGKKEEKNKKKKPTGGIVGGGMLSFDPDPQDDDLDQEKGSLGSISKKKREKRGRSFGAGMGYGGMRAPPANDDTDDRDSENDDVSVESKKGTSDRYGGEELEQLRSQQRLRRPLPCDNPGDVIAADGAGATEISVRVEGGGDKSERRGRLEEEEFISLSGNVRLRTTEKGEEKVVEVLTGEEAMAYAPKEEEEGEEDDEENERIDEDHIGVPGGVGSSSMSGVGRDVDEEESEERRREGEEKKVNAGRNDGERWEDEVARRAGVGTAASSPSRSPSAAARRRRPATSTDEQGPEKSLAEVKSILRSALSGLRARRGDEDGAGVGGYSSSAPSSSVRRNEAELSRVRDELSSRESEVRAHGEAFDYHVGLRERLAPRLGALRVLDDRLLQWERARDALEDEVYERIEGCRAELREDAIKVLKDAGLLERVVGGGGDDEERGGERGGGKEEGAATVDEFGRDLTSMSKRARSARFEKRRRRIPAGRRVPIDLESMLAIRTFDDAVNEYDVGDGDDEYDPEISDSERDGWHSRHEDLRCAGRILRDLVDERHQSLPDLVAEFREWERSRPEDYKRCYARLSLVDVLDVLVRLEEASSSSLDEDTEKGGAVWLGFVFKGQRQRRSLPSQGGDICDDGATKEEGDREKCGAIDGGSERQTSGNRGAAFRDYNALSGKLWYCHLKMHEDSNHVVREDDGGEDCKQSADQEGERESVLLSVLKKRAIAPFLAMFAIETTEKENSSDVQPRGLRYDPLSVLQTRRACSLFVSLKDIFSQLSGEYSDVKEGRSENVSERLTRAVVTRLRHFVDCTAVPLVKGSDVLLSDDHRLVSRYEGTEYEKDIADSVVYACATQALDLVRLVKNIVIHWIPVLNGIPGHREKETELARFILLDIIAMRILPILTSWQKITMPPVEENGDCRVTRRHVLGALVNVVKEAGWLEDEALMLYAAPLRAAAQSVGIV